MISVRSLLVGTFVLIGMLGAGSSARAEQFTARAQGRDLVVHTNPVPVVVHRVLPPFTNKHVTVREYRSGHLPAARRR